MVCLVEKLPEDEQKTKPAIQQHYAFALNRSAHLSRRMYFIIFCVCRRQRAGDRDKALEVLNNV